MGQVRQPLPGRGPLHATARSDVQERRGVGTPPPLGLPPPEQERPCAAARGAARARTRSAASGWSARPRHSGARPADRVRSTKSPGRPRPAAGPPAGGPGTAAHRRSPPGIDPAGKRRHQCGDVRWGFTVKGHSVHASPPHGNVCCLRQPRGSGAPSKPIEPRRIVHENLWRIAGSGAHTGN